MKDQTGILSIEADTDTRRELAKILGTKKLMTEFERGVIVRLTTLFTRRFTKSEAELIYQISSRRSLN